VLPPHVAIVDSAATTAAAVRQRLEGRAVAGAAAAANIVGAVAWLATDGAARFARVGSAFLGETLHAAAIEIIDL
jgi:glutamate racemase